MVDKSDSQWSSIKWISLRRRTWIRKSTCMVNASFDPQHASGQQVRQTVLRPPLLAYSTAQAERTEKPGSCTNGYALRMCQALAFDLPLQRFQVYLRSLTS